MCTILLISGTQALGILLEDTLQFIKEIAMLLVMQVVQAVQVIEAQVGIPQVGLQPHLELLQLQNHQ